MRVKRLENLSHCFSLQNLGKELHWQNCSHVMDFFSQPLTTQWLGAWKTLVLEKLEREDKGILFWS